MEEITKYRAMDGSEWTTPEQALAHEQVIESVNAAMEPLGKRPDDCAFTNGEGYIQHDKADVLKSRLAIHDLAKAGPLKRWIEDQKAIHGKTDYQLAVEVHPSWQMRMLDGGCSPLECAYGRLLCIDDQCREWGQPYYASHPHEAKMFQRNK